MRRRLPKSARRYIQKYNDDLELYFQKMERRAMAKKRRQQAMALTDMRRARYYARLEGEETK
jgi:hypothetical protein